MRVCLAMVALTWPFWLLVAGAGALEWWEARTVRPVSRDTLHRIDRTAEEAVYRATLRRELDRG